MVVAFIPAKQFEEGWWLLPCAQGLYFQSTDPKKGSSQVGVDVKAPLDNCKTVADANTSKKLDAIRKPYRNWSPTSLNIFQELAFAVVAGVHVAEDAVSATITQMECPQDAAGNLDFSKAAGMSLKCTVTGDKLDKVASVRLRNAKDATDSATADAPLTVSGDNTKGDVLFPLDVLGSLAAPLYSVYAVDKKGIESKSAVSVHLGLLPVLTSFTPETIEVGKNQTSATISITAKGYHLDQVDAIEFSLAGNTVDKKYTPDPGVRSATAFSFTLKTADFQSGVPAGQTENYDVTLFANGAPGAPSFAKLVVMNTKLCFFFLRKKKKNKKRRFFIGGVFFFVDYIFKVRS